MGCEYHTLSSRWTRLLHSAFNLFYVQKQLTLFFHLGTNHNLLITLT